MLDPKGNIFGKSNSCIEKNKIQNKKRERPCEFPRRAAETE